MFGPWHYILCKLLVEFILNGRWLFFVWDLLKGKTVCNCWLRVLVRVAQAIIPSRIYYLMRQQTWLAIIRRRKWWQPKWLCDVVLQRTPTRITNLDRLLRVHWGWLQSHCLDPAIRRVSQKKFSDRWPRGIKSNFFCHKFWRAPVKS